MLTIRTYSAFHVFNTEERKSQRNWILFSREEDIFHTIHYFFIRRKGSSYYFIRRIIKNLLKMIKFFMLTFLAIGRVSSVASGVIQKNIRTTVVENIDFVNKVQLEDQTFWHRSLSMSIVNAGGSAFYEGCQVCVNVDCCVPGNCACLCPPSCCYGCGPPCACPWND